MTGSLMFMVVLGLGVAVPFARSGKPVGVALRWSLIAAGLGAALFFGGMQAMTPLEHLNGDLNWAVLLGVMPLFLGGMMLVMVLGVLGLRQIGFGPEGDEE